MRAARYYGNRDLRLEEVRAPEAGPGDVKIRVRYAGICGSDLHEYYRGPIATCAEQPHPFSGVTNPVILGHELCGDVVDVGAGVERVAVGDTVAIHGVETCGRCEPCRRGRGRCRQYAVHGYTRDGGAFSDYTVVKERMAYPLPAGLSELEGALIEPMSVGMTAALRADVGPGETVAVHGAGPIGLGVLLALRARGVEVIVSDPAPLRRRAASRLGAAATLDPTICDVAASIRALTGSDGAAASVDAAGVSASINGAIQSTAEERRVVIAAMPSEPIELDLVRLHAAKLSVTTSTGTTPVPVSFGQVIELMLDGHYPSESWTETIAFDRMLEDGFEPLHRGEKIKVLVDMSA